MLNYTKKTDKAKDLNCEHKFLRIDLDMVIKS